MTAQTLTVTEAHCGPSRTGNGGYVGGLLAAHFEGAVTVRLIKGVPLDVPLTVEREGEEVCLRNGPVAIAVARPAMLTLEAPAPPSFAEAEAATRACPGFERHAFPNCFVCGTEREEGDGLRIFPGPIPDRKLMAAPWVPDARLADASGAVRLEYLWAPLECTGGFALYPHLVLMGELTVRIDDTLRAGERCVLVGWEIGREGRKFQAGSALYGEDGRTVAVGHATWIEVARERFVTLTRTGFGS